MAKRSALEKWLDELPEEELQREMDEWEIVMRQANIEYAKRREVLELKRRWREQYGSPSTAHAQTATEKTPEQESSSKQTLFPDRPANLRAAVLEVVNDGPPSQEWTTTDIRDGLVERGWMENSEKSVRTLQSALSRMQAEGRIVRVRHGVYQSAALAAASALAAANGVAEPGGESD